MECLSRGGVYTPLVEYSSKGGMYTTSMEYLSRGGLYTTSMEYFSRGGVYTTSMEYLPTGGCTPPRWNIYPEAGVHHLSGIFSPASHFPQCPIFPPCFFFGGGCSPVLHGLPFSRTFHFHDGFSSGGWLCVCGGGLPDFSLSLSNGKEGKEGAGTTLLSNFSWDVFYFMSLTRDAKSDFRLQTLYT